MRTINFNEMALLNGGQAVSVAAATPAMVIDGARQVSCAKEGAIYMLSLIGAIGSIAIPGGGWLLTSIAVGLTAEAYVSYFICQGKNM